MPSACKCPSSCVHDPNHVCRFQNLGREGVPAWDPTASPHTPPCVCRPAISWTLDFLARMSVKRRVPLWWPLTTIPASFRKATVLTMEGEGSAVMTLPRSMSHTCQRAKLNKAGSCWQRWKLQNGIYRCHCWQGSVQRQMPEGPCQAWTAPTLGPGWRGGDEMPTRPCPGTSIVAHIGMCVRAFVAAPSSRVFCSPNERGLVQGANRMCLACHQN